MILCLDIGNTQIYGGVFEGDEIKLRFRRNSNYAKSSDEMGVFLKGVLRENGIDPEGIQNISCCTVVPDVLHSVRNCCMKYFNKTPFILQPGVKSGLKIGYRNPVEVGADRIADAIAAVHKFPNRNLVVVDFGTATTFCAITKDREYLGGAIVAGLRISMEALEKQTARLPTVEILKPESVIGRSTVESIQSGLYYGSIGLIGEIVNGISKESFDNDPPLVIGTGGFSRLFEDSNVFNEIDGDLVLKGLFLCLKMNI